MFKLDERLANSSIFVADFPLCQLRLANESRYPWLLLIPRKPNTIEIGDLSESEQSELWQESAFVSAMLKALHKPDKLNIAAIGNIVEQCHVHHVARWRTDAAWPDPIWGKFEPIPYSDDERQRALTLLQNYIAKQRSTMR